MSGASAWQAEMGPARIDVPRLHALRTAVDTVVRAQEPASVGFLQRLLRQPTVSGAHAPEERAEALAAMAACMAHVETRARSLGMRWRIHDRIAACAEWPGSDPGAPSLGIAAHLDVVPAHGDWTHPPFGGEVRDGYIWGRGTQDDKGPVAAVFAACEALQRLGLRPRGDLRIFLGTMEETEDWPDIDLLLRRERIPDLTLVPDGAFPIVLGEKGIVTIRLRFAWDVVEPDPRIRMLGFEAGDRHNVVPDKAELRFACPEGRVVAQEALQVLAAAGGQVVPCSAPPSAEGAECLATCFAGVAAHGAFPEQGDNAALKALEALHNMYGDRGAGAMAAFLLRTCGRDSGASPGGRAAESPAARAGLTAGREGRTLEVPGGAEGGDSAAPSVRTGNGLEAAPGLASPSMGEETKSLGVVRAGPGTAEALVSVRFPIGTTAAQVLARWQSAAQEATGRRMRVEAATWGRPKEPVFVSPQDHPHVVRALQAAYRVATGREPTLGTIAGTTYAKVFPRAIGFGPQDPGADEPVLAHRADERVSLRRFRENIRTYALAIALLACDPEAFPRADAQVGAVGTRTA